jgi:hypothetical protein
MPIITAANCAGVTYREFKTLNPFLVSDVIPRGDLSVRVPEGRAKQFEKEVELWKSTCKPSVLIHKVSKGETLSGIAHKYDSTEQQICAWNNIARNKIRIGQTLKIYR